MGVNGALQIHSAAVDFSGDCVFIAAVERKQLVDPRAAAHLDDLAAG
jgi:hypothetical protein